MNQCKWLKINNSLKIFDDKNADNTCTRTRLKLIYNPNIDTKDDISNLVTTCTLLSFNHEQNPFYQQVNHLT